MTTNTPYLLPNGNIVKNAADIGAAIRTARKTTAMTQAQAAGLSNVGVRFLSDLENGKGSLQIDKVLQVLRCFGLECRLSQRNALKQSHG